MTNQTGTNIPHNLGNQIMHSSVGAPPMGQGNGGIIMPGGQQQSSSTAIYKTNTLD